MAAPIDLHAVSEREHERRSRFPWRIDVCTSTACRQAGADRTLAAVRDEVGSDGRSDEIDVTPTGCMGPCSRGPLVRVQRRGGDRTQYAAADPDLARRIVRRHVGEGAPIADHVLDLDVPFFSEQHRVVLANVDVIDADRLESAVAQGAYLALEKAITTMTPAEVVEEIRLSGLRGRGGAGYPTGTKWALLAGSEADRKYVIANGDEGDPGAFMDRAIMEDDPHRLLEGLAIAAYATGADRGYVYVRAEYPRAVERLDRAIRSARRNRLLGPGVLDTGFDLEMEVRIGAGAYVCGEETALLASIEGRRGTPRLRPPYPTERGLFGRPSMINNVETLANVAPIIARGAEWFRGTGTPRSPGTKVFALSGNLAQTGLIEVPMGIPLRTIVEDMGGGVPDGRTFKAAQTGGPSGGCVPHRHLDTPVDYESLRELGSIMGSGGLVVMDDSVAMPELARYFMQFCMAESCGKCVPCRAGTVQLHALLDGICEGTADADDLALLEELCAVVRDTSLCGLGQSAPNPVLSTLHHFRHEFEDRGAGRV